MRAKWACSAIRLPGGDWKVSGTTMRLLESMLWRKARIMARSR